MKTTLATLVIAAVLAAPSVFAHENEKHDKGQVTPGRDAAGAQLDIVPTAAEAVATVDRFAAAMSAGDMDALGAELDPNVLILESGGAEHSRDEYLQGHAKHDAEFMKTAHVMLKRRTARADGNLAWVASESEIHAMKGQDMLMIGSTESMVLQRGPQGWKIVHIHWSSRRAGK